MPASVWIIFNILVLFVLFLDLFVFHRKRHVIAWKEALLWSAVWITLALLFNVYIYFAMGKEAAASFLAGYLIEKSLSVDNLFVFILIFNYFNTPKDCLHKVLFWGILGAFFFRALFIFLGIALIYIFHPLIYIFGLFLIFTGIRFWYQKEQVIKPKPNIVSRLFRRIFPITDDYVGDHFFVIRGSKLWATPLMLVLITIETTDIVFAIDSIPAIFGITLDPFIIYTSNILAILGLRALFFVLSAVVESFKYLHYGIATILVVVGLKMLASDLFRIPPFIALGIIVLILLISIISSVLFGKSKKE